MSFSPSALDDPKVMPLLRCNACDWPLQNKHVVSGVCPRCGRYISCGHVT